MSKGRLFVSFWTLCLENLPEGGFTRRRIAVDEARAAVEPAREAGRLLCVSDTDLMAPYHARERDKHAQLCRALAEHCGLAISMEEFCGKSDEDEDGEALYFINPLDCVRVEGLDRLMIVTCAYEFPRSEAIEKDLDFEIVVDSITFDMIEAVGPGSTPVA